MNRFIKFLSIFVGVAIVIIFFMLLLIIVPLSQSYIYRAKFTPEDIQRLELKDRIQLERNAADIENATRLTLAQIIGGLALLSGLYFTYQNVKAAQDNVKIAQENLRITEEGKLTERFSNAVELLGNEKLDIRLGGVYALERIARDSKKDHWTVMEVLTAFVRENSRLISENDTESTQQTDNMPQEDIQAILTVIGRRKWIETEKNNLLLWRTNLTNYILIGGNFSNADFRSTLLTGTQLQSANLNKSLVNNADFSNAYLAKTNLGSTVGLKINQIVSAIDFDLAILSDTLKKELEEWQVNQSEKKQAQA